jgi:hypothetical protein
MVLPCEKKHIISCRRMVHVHTLYRGSAHVRHFLERVVQLLVNQAHSSVWCTVTGNSGTF